MPPRAMQLPAPANWQDFELLCRDLFAAEWGDPNTQRHGRSGQEQDGVDVFGRRGGKWLGVQCKLREQHDSARPTAKELAAELKKAKKFREKLSVYYFATTAPRDTELQKRARKLSTCTLRVVVLGWQDLVEMLHRHEQVLLDHFAWDRPDAVRAVEVKNYLGIVKERLGALPLAAIHEHRDHAPTLDAVYTALDVEWLLEAADEHTVGPNLPRRARATTGTVDYLRALTEYLQARRPPQASPDGALRELRAVEFLAAHPRAVLLGPAGSGKSAFASFVALCLANERLGHTLQGLSHLADPSDELRTEDVWPHGALIPLYVELRAFVADGDSFPPVERTPHAGHLLDHLANKHAKVRLPDGFLKYLREDLLAAADPDRPGRGAGRGILLLLDGFDETPVDVKVRMQVQRVVHAFLAAYPQTRVLVTSRPYAYANDAPWQLIDPASGRPFSSAKLAELDTPAIARFVHAYYTSLAQSGSLGQADAGDRPEQLLRRIARDPHLRPLARRPLLLTLLTSLHASAKLGSGGRATVYRESIEVLFDRWNQIAHAEPATTSSATGRTTSFFHELVGLSRDAMLPVLRRVAKKIHTQQGATTGEEAATIPVQMLLAELDHERQRLGLRQAKVDAQNAFRYLDERSGLLLSDGDGNFRFPHRSYQEFLAAQWFCDDEEFPAELVRASQADPVLWREVLGYCVLLQNRSNVRTLLEEIVPSDDAIQDADYLRTIAVAAALAERGDFREEGIENQNTKRLVVRVKQVLVRCLETSALRAANRIEAGEALGQHGDPRIGDRPDNFLPLSPGAKVALGKYLVTVQEFAEFVDAGGYSTDRYWESDGGLAIRKRRSWIEPEGFPGQREHPNRPVVGVSWYEAKAYCRWRSETTGSLVRLPTAAERDAAAGKGEWPWGATPEPSPELANYDFNVGRPSPIGCYARGRGAGGHLDIAGNVWEWVDATKRVLRARGMAASRGGSWAFDAVILRADRDHVFDAGFRDDDLGFRLAAPART